MKTRNLIPLVTFLVTFIALSYSDTILLGEVKRYENVVLAAIMAGMVFVIALLLSKDYKNK